MKTSQSLIPSESIGSLIILIRQHKVILDRDIAILYGVKTRGLNKAVSRNLDRFSRRFYDRAYKGGVRKLEVPLWNIKLGRHKKTAQGIY